MNCFAFSLIGLFIGCLFGGILSFIFFIKRNVEYKKDYIENKYELERYRNEFCDKYVDDGYDAY